MADVPIDYGYPTTDNLKLSLVPDGDAAWGPAMRAALTMLDKLGAGRTTSSADTANLAPGELGVITIDLALTADIIAVGTSSPAEVRLYDRLDALTADAARPSTTIPTPGAGLVCHNITGPGALVINQDPVSTFSNRDDLPVITGYLYVKNLDAAAHVVTVTITFLSKEILCPIL